MKLFEMFDKAVPGYQDTGSDNSQLKLKDTRKTKLTLRQIRKLRKMNDVRSFEHVSNLKKVRKQYAPVAQEGAPTL